MLSRLLTAPPPRENCEPQKGGQAVSGPLAVVEVEAAEPWRSMALTRPSQRPLPRTAPATPTPAMAAGTAAPATAARKAALLLQLAPLPGRWEEASEAPPLAERTERTPAAKLRCQHRRRMRRGQERARSQRGKPPVLRRGGASRFRADRGEPRRIERTLKGAAERSNRTLSVVEEPAAREPVPTTAVAVPVPSGRCAIRRTSLTTPTPTATMSGKIGHTGKGLRKTRHQRSLKVGTKHLWLEEENSCFNRTQLT